MAEITKTKKELEMFHLHANDLISKHKGPDTKLQYALRKIVKASKAMYEDYISEIQDKRVLAASVDEKGNILEDAGNKWKFTPEKLITLNSDIKKIGREVVKINQFIVDCPVDLAQDFKNNLEGFVFAEEEEPSDDEVAEKPAVEKTKNSKNAK